MGLTLEKVVPWGRSRLEYDRMFALTPADYQLSILDCGGGPASFNVEITQQGNCVISCDPIYQFSTREIAQRIRETYPIIIKGVEENRNNYIWQGEISSPSQLGEVRMAAMEKFLADFPLGKEQGRYITAELPHLPFANQQFDLALCSHLLFSYSDQLSAAFHLNAMQELCRVATEVRIFPLLNISGEPSPHLALVINRFQQQGYRVEIQQVNYEFQRGGNQMMRVFTANG